MKRIVFGLIGLAALGACGDDEEGIRPAGNTTSSGSGGEGGSGAAPAGPEPNACLPDSPPENPIDQAFCARVGPVYLEPASDRELCRRIFVDLTGRIPTPADYEAVCAGGDAETIASAVLASDAFRGEERRYWVQEKLQESYYRVHGTVLVEADSIIDDLASGAQSYPAFVARVFAHPAITCNLTISYDELGTHYGYEEVVERMFRAFLGRAPLGSEADDVANLLRVWECASYSYEVPMSNSDFPFVGYLNPQNCGALGNACISEAFGETVQVDLSAEIGGTVAYADFVGAVPGGVQAELEKPGYLLAAQPELWDEAADAALRRLLGWWKSTPNKPDSDLPEVRSALAGSFAATGGADVRALYSTVITSLLYTTANELDPELNKNAPPWLLGPTKPMAPEVWTNAAGVATGLELGHCDIHTEEYPSPDDDSENGGPIFNFYLREPQPADLWEQYPGYPFDYYTSVSGLGGCRGGKPRQVHPGLVTLFGQLELSAAICYGASDAGVLLPASFDETAPPAEQAAAITSDLFARFLGREPSDAELAVALGEAACLDEASCDVPTLAASLCGAILRSSGFLYY